MTRQKNMAALFSVIVVGGIDLAHGEDQQENQLSEPSTCHIEIVKHNYGIGGVITGSEHTCIDGKTIEEINEIIEEAKEDTCATPYCRCWLG